MQCEKLNDNQKIKFSFQNHDEAFIIARRRKIDNFENFINQCDYHGRY